MVEQTNPDTMSSKRSLSREGYLSPFSDTRVMLAFALAALCALVFFNRFPQIDIWMSQLFFAPADCPPEQAGAVCGNFPAALDPILVAIRDVLHYTPVVIGIALIGAALAAAQSSEPRLRMFAKGAWTAITTLLLSGLLLVNVVLKEVSGRPRPVDTDLFGGDFPFVEAGRFVDYCQTNCSFVSGEAATAMWLVCLVALVPLGFRRIALAITLPVAVLAIGLRIAFGGHYLSDTVIAALLTMTVFAALATIGRRAGWYDTRA